MLVASTKIDGMILIKPRQFGDNRGFLMETWSQSRFAEIGIITPMLQDNLTWSEKHVLRGLHFQNPFGQAKLITVLKGTIFDVAVDLRQGSANYGTWFGTELSETNRLQAFVPAGCAHGFCVLSDGALVSYKCSELYHPEAEVTLRWNDPGIGIQWPIAEPMLSTRDAEAPLLIDIPILRLPVLETTSPPLPRPHLKSFGEMDVLESSR